MNLVVKFICTQTNKAFGHNRLKSQCNRNFIYFFVFSLFRYLEVYISYTLVFGPSMTKKVVLFVVWIVFQNVSFHGKQSNNAEDSNKTRIRGGACSGQLNWPKITDLDFVEGRGFQTILTACCMDVTYVFFLSSLSGNFNS